MSLCLIFFVIRLKDIRVKSLFVLRLVAPRLRLGLQSMGLAHKDSLVLLMIQSTNFAKFLLIHWF
jgi:hypothetical protein